MNQAAVVAGVSIVVVLLAILAYWAIVTFAPNLFSITGAY
jgi:hypothetical protein